MTSCYHVSETSNVDTMCETTFDIMAIQLLEKNLVKMDFVFRRAGI